MHWLLDVDNIYGFGTLRRRHRPSPPTSTPTSAARRSRSGRPSRSRPVRRSPTAARTASWTCSSRTARYAKQWRYTDAPDADARAVQAAYWALTWAKAQGKAVGGLRHGRQGRARWATTCGTRCTTSTSRSRAAPHRRCAAGTGKNSAALPADLVLRLGRRERHQRRLGLADRLQPQPRRLPEPARGVGAVQRAPRSSPKSRDRRRRLDTSLKRQLEFYRWLQSTEGAIAGGATNSWDGRYAHAAVGHCHLLRHGLRLAAGLPRPAVATSGSASRRGRWSGSRSTTTSPATRRPRRVLDKWVAWATANTTLNADGTYQIPSTLEWTGQPDTWNAGSPGANSGLHVTHRRLHQRRRRGRGVRQDADLLRGQVRQRHGQDHRQGPARRHVDRTTRTPWASRSPETRTDYNGDVLNDQRSTSPRAGPAPCPTATRSTPARRSCPSGPSTRTTRTGRRSSYLKGGAAPTFNYHRFWAQVDIAIALAEYGRLFP